MLATQHLFLKYTDISNQVVSDEIVDHRRSPLVKGGLEILVKLIAQIDEAEKNEAFMKRLKQLITENYREPDADVKFEDCTEEV